MRFSSLNFLIACSVANSVVWGDLGKVGPLYSVFHMGQAQIFCLPKELYYTVLKVHPNTISTDIRVHVYMRVHFSFTSLSLSNAQDSSITLTYKQLLP